MPEKPIETVLNDIEQLNIIVLAMKKEIIEIEKMNIEILNYVRRREAEYKKAWF